MGKEQRRPSEPSTEASEVEPKNLMLFRETSPYDLARLIGGHVVIENGFVTKIEDFKNGWEIDYPSDPKKKPEFRIYHKDDWEEPNLEKATFTVVKDRVIFLIPDDVPDMVVYDYVSFVPGRKPRIFNCSPVRELMIPVGVRKMAQQAKEMLRSSPEWEEQWVRWTNDEAKPPIILPR
ncbi:MAG: hypothetical protein A2W22_02300 [Candidatus Levybacteria bacterium RBG_16_35_11]|nr:MAG: hypothetical protein A2W22_02300 [Candidatus Levybacteria bacterium RBG_16_35_11]